MVSLECGCLKWRNKDPIEDHFTALDTCMNDEIEKRGRGVGFKEKAMSVGHGDCEITPRHVSAYMASRYCT